MHFNSSYVIEKKIIMIYNIIYNSWYTDYIQNIYAYELFFY